MTKNQRKELVLILLSASLLIAGFFVDNYPVQLGIWLIAYLLSGAEVLKNAAGGILRGQIFDENFLMAIATIGAVIIGEYAEAVAVMVLYQLGEWFQGYAVGKSRDSIASLMDICPEEARIERDGLTMIVDPYEVLVGDTMVIKAGEKIPLDGIIIEGTSSLNTAALTGESLPKDVTVGDDVISGCVNLSGLLRVRAEKPYEDSTVSRILEMVETAADRKSKAESFITRFSRYYTPCVCIAALLLFLIPPILFKGEWADWGHRALSFLVVSCPCALVISVPLSFFGGIGAASRNGILLKGSNYLESLAKVSTIVMDKTGTLTKGRFTVTDVYPAAVSETELIQMAASLESHSTHPISRAICEYAGVTENHQMIQQVQEQAGYGMTGQLDGVQIAAGNEKLMASLGVSCSNAQRNGTVVHVAKGKEYAGCIVVDDQPKDDAKEALQEMRHLGIQQLVMLTGDSKGAANAVAAFLNIDQVHAQLLPSDKVELVEKLLSSQPAGEQLAFVGDGINDAPVLTRADVGIAMGALGSDAAVEAADVVLMDDQLEKLATAIRISRKTLTIARQNIIFALAIKLLVLILVSIGIGNMWMAVFADVGVSILAILNAMRTLRYHS